MKKAILLGLGVGVAFLTSRLLRQSRSRYSQTESRPELADFTDLNEASNNDLADLGLDEAMVSQIVENRPYRNKLDLMSRLVIPEDVYETIRQKIGVRKAYEPVKVA